MLVYLVTNLITGKRYVGQTRNTLKDRWEEHLWEAHGNKGSRYFCRAIRKYGESKFTVIEIEQCYGKVSLSEAEAHWVQVYQCEVPNGYNLTTGGELEYEFTEDVKRRISEAHGGLSEAKQINVAKRYRAGATSYELASEFKVGPTTIINAVRRQGVPIRSVAEAKGGLPPEKELEAIQKYLSGVSAKQVGEECGVSSTAIMGTLKRNMISRRGVSEALGGLPPEKELEVVQKYLALFTTIQLAKEYGVHDSTIGCILERHGVPRRKGSVAHGGLPPEKELEVVQKYHTKVGSGQLAKEYGVSGVTILNILERHGIQRRTVKEAGGGLSLEKELEVIQGYLAKKSAKQLGEEYGIHGGTVASILKRHGVRIRTQSETQKARYAAKSFSFTWWKAA